MAALISLAVALPTLMIILRYLANAAALGSALAVIVASVSTTVWGCSCQQSQQGLQAYDATKVNSTNLSVNPNSLSSSVGQSNTSAQANPIGGAAIAVALVLAAGGSTASLAYKAWSTKKSVSPTISVQPKLAHPELKLTDLPQAALPRSGEFLDLKREVALTR